MPQSGKEPPCPAQRKIVSPWTKAVYLHDSHVALNILLLWLTTVHMERHNFPRKHATCVTKSPLEQNYNYRTINAKIDAHQESYMSTCKDNQNAKKILKH